MYKNVCLCSCLWQALILPKIYEITTWFSLLGILIFWENRSTWSECGSKQWLIQWFIFLQFHTHEQSQQMLNWLLCCKLNPSVSGFRTYICSIIHRLHVVLIGQPAGVSLHQHMAPNRLALSPIFSSSVSCPDNNRKWGVFLLGAKEGSNIFLE